MHSFVSLKPRINSSNWNTQRNTEKTRRFISSLATWGLAPLADQVKGGVGPTREREGIPGEKVRAQEWRTGCEGTEIQLGGEEP